MCLIYTAEGFKTFPETENTVRNPDGNAKAPKTKEKLAIEWESEAEACEVNGMAYFMAPACYQLAEEFRNVRDV